MLKELVADLKLSEPENLAKSFSRIGRFGFWVQVVVGAIPVLLMGYAFVLANSHPGSRAGLNIVEYLTTASLLLLLFTTLWFYRHTRLAKRIADPETCPPLTSLMNAVWVGLIFSSIGLLFSMIVMVIETSHLLLYFLQAPQAGVPVIQTGDASWVSAVDMISLTVLSLLIFAEVIVLILSLWLLFRTMQTSLVLPGNDVDAELAPETTIDG